MDMSLHGLRGEMIVDAAVLLSFYPNRDFMEVLEFAMIGPK